MNKIAAEILIVGGGPAGIAAALAAAKCGRSVTIIDDNPRLGGQIWRAGSRGPHPRGAVHIAAAVEDPRIRIINDVAVFDVSSENTLIAHTPEGRTEFDFQMLILAAGAREIFLPFPGWTLPNVFGAGGLQALAKGGLNIAGKRVVVAGTGPLLLAVAENLASKGAIIAVIVEQASAASINRFARSLWRTPAKLVQAVRLRAKLKGTQYLKDAWVTAAHGPEKLRSITINVRGKSRTIDCDLLAVGFHLAPNLELAELLECEISNGFVAVNEFQRTSRPSIFCAGEQTGIRGVEASLVEGTIAGCAAAGDEESARKHFAERFRSHRFAAGLYAAFALRDELRTLADDATLVCRCEDVNYGKLKKFDNWRTAKLQTRCGMGPCQGRVCGPATRFLFGWKRGSARPPIFPVKLEDL